MQPDPGARIVVVVERSLLRAKMPWPTRPWRASEELLQITSDMSDQALGLAMKEVLGKLSAKGSRNTVHTLFSSALDALPWCLFPGLEVQGSDGKRVTTSCCACLDLWPEWAGLLDGTAYPFLGHSPDVGAEVGGDQITFYVERTNDGDAVETRPEVTFSFARFREALGELEAELVRIADRVESWATALSNPDLGRKVGDGFRLSFKIGPQPTESASA